MEEKILKYLTGDMDATEQSVFEREIQASESLRQEVEDYRIVFSTIHDIEQSEPADRMQSRFDSMLNKEIELLGKPKLKVVKKQSNVWKMIGIAASFALLGLFIGYQMQPNPSTIEANGLSEQSKNDFIHLVSTDRTSHKMDGLSMLEKVSHLDDEVMNTLRDVLYHDPSTNVRLAVIDALVGHLDQKEVVEILADGLSEIEKPIIKIGIIQAISGIRSKQMVPALENELKKNDLDSTVREELHVGIMKLSRNI